MSIGVFLALVASALLTAVTAVRAAEPPGPPMTLESWVEEVKPDSARLRAAINPNGSSSTYRFEVVSQAAFQQSGFLGAVVVPPSGGAPLGSGATPLLVSQPIGPPLTPLTAATTYRYRVTATNQEGTTVPLEHRFTTQPTELHFGLPDGRGWEMVSPREKNGGAIAGPEAIFGGGELQAAPGSAASGASVTYGSATAFGDAQGAPAESQYLSTRTASGWTTEAISPPVLSAAYGTEPDGAPYRIFSSDLSRGLLFGGLPCRGGLPGCPAPNPVLPGSGAPAGYMAYYLREGDGSFSSLLSPADLSHTALAPEAFSVSFAGGTPDLSHIVLSSCAALTADAVEIPDGAGGCEESAQNLYEWSGASLLALNLLPGQGTTTAGAALAAPIGAISTNGSRVFFSQEGDLYLRQAGETKLVSPAAQFQAASADGGIAYLTKSGHLYRYLTNPGSLEDLTPSGGVVGVLGASEDGSTVYFQGADGIERWREGATTMVAPGAQAATESDYPPATATSRVSSDGSHLAFLSTEELDGYDNGGRTEVYLYGPIGGGPPQLVCASCNPTGERANGSASVPGTPANGSTHAFRPRVLSENGRRLFFDSSDELVVGDTDNEPDVYQWEARGEGDCETSPGCVSLISSGRALEGASFVDASGDGTDVYFLTDESLVGEDPGSIDLYDARVGGGFPEAPPPIPCIADACQALPPTPEDPEPGSSVENAGNPSLRIVRAKAKKHHKPRRHKKKHRRGKGSAHAGGPKKGQK
jgi:hypothetical protein